jgi:hypothetical protein
VAEPRDTLKMLAVPRLMFAGLVIWAGWYAAHLRNRPSFGTVIIDRSSFALDGCRSVPVAGRGSIGAELRESDRNVLRIVRDEHGVWLHVYGSDGAISISRYDCSQWKVQFSSEDEDPFASASGKPTIKGAVGGDLDFTCTVRGRRIDGMVFFEHCAP